MVLRVYSCIFVDDDFSTHLFFIFYFIFFLVVGVGRQALLVGWCELPLYSCSFTYWSSTCTRTYCCTRTYLPHRPLQSQPVCQPQNRLVLTNPRAIILSPARGYRYRTWSPKTVTPIVYFYGAPLAFVRHIHTAYTWILAISHYTDSAHTGR
jgi:hypothetical protein